MPPHPATRATSAKLRQAIFSTLGSVEGLRIADLFAGSGILGIEALSRGAASATFVEASGAAAATVRRNLERASFLERSTVVVAKVEHFLHSTRARFDLVLADPPYALPDLDKLILAIGERALEPGGRFVIEHSSRRPAPEVVAGLRLLLDRNHGDSAFAVYAKS